MEEKRVDSIDRSVQPPFLHESYRSTVLRAPRRPLVPLAASLSELTGPVYGDDAVQPLDSDLTRNAAGSEVAIGERLIVTGRVLEESGRPVPNALVEVWQANAAGRYRHHKDDHDAPLDPNFSGGGRCLTNATGEYTFTTIRPGAYPWKNHPNAWRPAHIHFSIFGHSFISRLVTQMYFPGDPLLPLDPIFNSVPEQARDLLVASYAHQVTRPLWALGFKFDIVLAGGRRTPFEGG